MKIISILFLSIMINANISGLTGVVLKQSSLSNKVYNYIYIIINIIILLLSYYLLNKISFWNNIPFAIINYKIIYIVLLIPVQLYIEYRLLYATTNKHTIYRLPQNRGSLLVIGSMEELSYRVVILGALLYMSDNNYFVSITLESCLYTLNHLYLIRNAPKKFNLILSKFIFGFLASGILLIGGVVSAVVFHLIYNIIILYGFSYIFKKEVTNG